MKITSSGLLVQLVAVCSLIVSNTESVQLDKYGKFESNEDGFRKLCLLEHESKIEQQEYLEEEEEDQLRDDQLLLITVRLALGVQLGRAVCPPAIARELQLPDRSTNQKRQEFDKMCADEAERELLCSELRSARQTELGPKSTKPRMERRLCKQHANLVRARKQFGETYQMPFCDLRVVEFARRGALVNLALVFNHQTRQKNNMKQLALGNLARVVAIQTA